MAQDETENTLANSIQSDRGETYVEETAKGEAAQRIEGNFRLQPDAPGGFVVERMRAFWEAVAGTSAQFDRPSRSAFAAAERRLAANSATSNARITRLPKGVGEDELPDALQVVLQEVFYQIYEAFGRSETSNKRPEAATGRRRVEGTTSDAPAARTDEGGGGSSGAGGARPDGRSDAGRAGTPSGTPGASPSAPDIRVSDQALGLARPLSSLSVRDAIAVLGRLFQANAQDPARLAEMMVRHVGPLVASESAKLGGESHETIVDGLITLIVPIMRLPNFGEPLVAIVQTLRRLLGGGAVTERTEGAFVPLSVNEMQSLTGLATLASAAIENHSQSLDYEPRLTFNYNEVLRMIALRGPTGTAQDRTNMARMLETAANNAAASIARYRQRTGKTPSDPALLDEVIALFVDISVGLSESGRVDDPESAERVAHAFGIDTSGFETETWVKRMNGMHMVSAPELKKDAYFLLAIRYATTALLREPMGVPENAASAFFNAGVELLRVDRTEERAAPLRVVLNGLGLLAALTSSDDPVTAFVRNDGSDCLVNLFGSLIGLVEQHDGLFPPAIVGPLIGEVEPLIDLTGPMPPGDAERVRRSIERIRRNGPEMPQTDPLAGEMADRVADLVNHVAEGFGVERTVAPGMPVEERAQFVLAAFAASAHPFEDDVATSLVARGLDPALAGKGEALVSAYLTDFVREMMERQGDPFDQIRELYERTVGGTETTFGEVGPLVATGLLDQADWEDVARAALGFEPERDIQTTFELAFGPLRPPPPDPVGHPTPQGPDDPPDRDDPVASADPTAWPGLPPTAFEDLLQDPRFRRMILGEDLD
ncbi:MAG: hypothetical protein ACU0CO_05835 [Shimia sp.]